MKINYKQNGQAVITGDEKVLAKAAGESIEQQFDEIPSRVDADNLAKLYEKALVTKGGYFAAKYVAMKNKFLSQNSGA